MSANQLSPETRIGYGNSETANLPYGYDYSTTNGGRNIGSGSTKSSEKMLSEPTDLDNAGQDLGTYDYLQSDDTALTRIALRRRMALQRALKRRKGSPAQKAGLDSLLDDSGDDLADLTGAGGLLGSEGLNGLNSKSDGLLGLATSGFGGGHEPEYGYGPSTQCKTGLNPLLLLLTLAAAAAGFYFIYTKLSSLAGRKKRDLESTRMDMVDRVYDFVRLGNGLNFHDSCHKRDFFYFIIKAVVLIDSLFC